MNQTMYFEQNDSPKQKGYFRSVQHNGNEG